MEPSESLQFAFDTAKTRLVPRLAVLAAMSEFPLS
jgi:hypothetical protein